jgi:hypothetical protein
MSLENESGIIKGNAAEIMADIRLETGLPIFVGEESFLANSALLGVIAGTHDVIRYPTADGGTVPMIVEKNKPRGDGII